MKAVIRDGWSSGAYTLVLTDAHLDDKTLRTEFDLAVFSEEGLNALHKLLKLDSASLQKLEAITRDEFTMEPSKFDKTTSVRIPEDDLRKKLTTQGDVGQLVLELCIGRPQTVGDNLRTGVLNRIATLLRTNKLESIEETHGQEVSGSEPVSPTRQ